MQLRLIYLLTLPAYRPSNQSTPELPRLLSNGYLVLLAGPPMTVASSLEFISLHPKLDQAGPSTNGANAEILRNIKLRRADGIPLLTEVLVLGSRNQGDNPLGVLRYATERRPAQELRR
jgi:hypothetical protein